MTTTADLLNKLENCAQRSMAIMQRTKLLPSVLPLPVTQQLIHKFKKYAIIRKARSRIARLEAIQQAKIFAEAYDSKTLNPRDFQCLESQIVRLGATIMEKSLCINEEEFEIECKLNIEPEPNVEDVKAETSLAQLANESSNQDASSVEDNDAPEIMTQEEEQQQISNEKEPESTSQMVTAPSPCVESPPPPTTIDSLRLPNTIDSLTPPTTIESPPPPATIVEYKFLVPVVRKLPKNITDAYMSGKPLVFKSGMITVEPAVGRNVESWCSSKRPRGRPLKKGGKNRIHSRKYQDQ